MQELFGALTCGGALLLAAPGGEKDTQYLARLCHAQRVSCIVLVPSALEVLMQARPCHAFLPPTVYTALHQLNFLTRYCCNALDLSINGMHT